MDDFSIVIRAKNEERWIGHAIQSVLDYIEQPQIIVVDDNSQDGTISIVRQFQHDPELNNDTTKRYAEIKMVQIDDYSPGRALNLGVSHATREHVLILSSHCVINQFDATKARDQLEKYICIFGNQSPIYNGRRISKRYLWSHFGQQKVENMYSEMEERYFLHNALALYKKQSLIDNPFDENLVGKEDRYWAKSVIDSGGIILYEPDIQADHHYTVNGNTWKGIG